MDILKTIKDTFTDTILSIKYFFNEEMVITRKTIAVTCTIFTLLGIIYGFLVAPVKRGIHVNITNNENDPYIE